MDKHPPLEKTRRELKINWYRSRVDRGDLRELTARSNALALAQAGGHFLLYLATGALAFWMWSLGVWLAFAAAILIHGIVASFLRGISTHELAHGTVFQTKWLNRVFLVVFSLLNWWNWIDYSMSHTYHHRYTLHPDGDREVQLPLKPVPGPIALLQLVTANLFLPPGRTFSSGGFFPTALRYVRVALGMSVKSNSPSGEWIASLHEDLPVQARKSAWWCRVTLVFHGAIVAVAVVTGVWVLPILVTVAPFIAGIVLYSVGLPQHCGLKNNNPDFRKCARSIKLGPILTFLYWQMNWHAEHHMYAAVPCYRLGKLARTIASDMPEPRSLAEAWREMRETWKRQQTDPSFQWDLPLPPSATASNDSRENGHGTGLERSIGELAPDGLD